MTDEEIAALLQQAHEELEEVQITYQDWKARCKPGGFYEEKGLDPHTETHWGKAFAMIKQAQRELSA
jgi:hypothetical protein